MKARISVVVLMVLLGTFLLGPTAALAAEYSPTLEYQLSKAQSSDLVSAIVILESPIDIRALDDRLHVEKATKARRHAEVLAALHYNAESTQPKFRTELDQATLDGVVKGYTAYWIENLFVIYATKDFIEGLRSRGDVKYLTENFKPELIEPIMPTGKQAQADFSGHNALTTRTLPPGIDEVGARRVNEELGITGNGVIIGSLDTGVMGNHVALSARWRGNFAPAWQCWRDPAGYGTTTPSDGYGHGTHTVGTMCGRAISGTDTVWVGCAPNARWISDDAIDMSTGTPFNNAVVDAFQWFTDPDTVTHSAAAVPDVVQNSWGVNGGFAGYTTCFDYWNTAVLNCEAGGTVVTWSAGNEGPGATTLRTPANYSMNAVQVFSVGAVDGTTSTTPPYPIAGFSSRGPTPCTPFSPNDVKPEIASPGVNVYSSYNDGAYTTMSGTSMAGPHVAGIVALMREACPNCDPQTIKMALENTAIRTGYVTPPATEDNTFGNGFIDGYAAVVAVSNLGHVVGVVRDASNNPIAGATVSNPAGLQSVLTNATGNYDIPLSAGTYTLRYAKFAYVTQNIPGIVVTTGNNTTQNVNLALAPTGTLQGTVTSCAGGPAVGATVTVIGTPIAPATTDGVGHYIFTLVPQGTYNMSASGAGCGLATVNGVVVTSNTTQNFTLPADPRFLCSAADAAGYIACENGDTGGPTYNWFEVSPNAAGPGTVATSVIGDDAGQTVALPFTFRLYGQPYTSVWVCTNGFASFSTTSTTFGNVALPTTTIGYAVAPMWDDLTVPGGTTGEVSYYYLTSENAFIIEWRNIPPLAGGATSTFEIYLYNVATNPSPTGDSQIKIQYQTVGASGTGSTVGVQSGTVANQYTFNGANDPNAQGLVNSRAICYGGCTPPVVGTLTGTITMCTGGPAANATVSFPASFYPAITANASGVYTQQVVPGTYSVRGDKSPCSFGQVNNIVVNANQTVTANVTLRAPGVVQGTVTSCVGGPAVGATVSLPTAGVPSVTTNAAGFYQFPQVSEGTWQIVTALAGCWPDTGSVAVTSGNTTTRNVTLISNPALSCSPPDGYGFVACENVDPLGPVFSWRAITPSEGGTGTLVTGLLDDNFVGPFTCPFTMKLYGTDYSQYYVGSNGYMSFGAGSGSIPTACPPMTGFPAGYYVFPCDMYETGGGQVATLYDAANHVFILEYYNVPHYSAGPNESFEIIVYDPTFYPTATGDANVVYQYNTANQVSNVYAGMQNGAALFIDYACGTTIPPSSLGIAAGRAVRFSTGAGCVGSPTAVITPASITKSVPLNGITTDSVHICNTGVCPLNWAITYHQISPVLSLLGMEPQASPNMPKDLAEGRMLNSARVDKTHVAVDTRHGRDQLDAQGGPDIFGYRWKDSNEPAGPGVPTFNWVEINTIGTNTGLHSDDGTINVGLPFNFSFYGTSYASVWVSTNGFINFGATGYSVGYYTNAALPSPTAPPAALVAPFWDDLRNDVSGDIFYYNDAANNRFIVEYQLMPFFSGTGTCTFEVLFYTDGHIIFQYLSMTGVNTSCTVGQQNATATDGLQVVFNAAYVTNNLAVQLAAAPPVPQWCSIVPPTSGQILPTTCSYVHLNFNSAGLAAGQYTGSLTVTNNDAAHNPTTIPLTFIVGTLDAPTQLTLFYDPIANQLLLRWQSTGAPDYRVYSATSLGGPYSTLVGSPNTNSLAIPFNSATARLFFQVTSWDGTALESAPSHPIHFSTD